MPVISITMGPTTEDRKKQLVEKLTKAAMEVTNMEADHFTVLVQELPLENIGVGGKTVKELRAGK
jgi:4-oxalocrotonate tautomerase